MPQVETYYFWGLGDEARCIDIEKTVTFVLSICDIQYSKVLVVLPPGLHCGALGTGVSVAIGHLGGRLRLSADGFVGWLVLVSGVRPAWQQCRVVVQLHVLQALPQIKFVSDGWMNENPISRFE